MHGLRCRVHSSAADSSLLGHGALGARGVSVSMRGVQRVLTLESHRAGRQAELRALRRGTELRRPRVWPRALRGTRRGGPAERSRRAAFSSNGRLTLENPFKHVGVSASEWQWTEEHIVAGRAPLVVRVSPGHPLCGRWKVPLVVQAQAGHTLLAACQRCGARETHALPAAASLYPAALGALAAEHRTDRR